MSAALLTGSLMVGGALVAAPAAYAGYEGYASANAWTGSKAQVVTWGTTRGQAWAKHACQDHRTGWVRNGTARASAWCGYDGKPRAHYYTIG